MRAYFDINRMMKLSDKFADESVVTVLEQVVARMVEISEKIDSKQVLKQC